ncbi:HDIG domain-containing metalloprotein [Hydrogenibacillus sp. N12]|uniref:HD family phosphohydrolase n=1 Tax=Hydrogenibacillus sp. N12 TaxID=2866627 RepID=UPI001C7DBDAD|nr:HDIG domain-containing metalloprotein [Hydrogenibacillus sp. N12]QZA32238.1 HDIG domain-containing protein [Hydrogenibacillus sp. N12]
MAKRRVRPPFWRRPAIFAVAVLAFLLFKDAVLPQSFHDLKLGARSTERIYAPKTVYDAKATERARQEAMAAVPNVYKVDESVTKMQLANLDRIFEDIAAVDQDETLTREERIEKVRRLIPYDLTPSVYETLASLPPETLRTIQYWTKSIVEGIMQAGVDERELAAARAKVNEQLILAELSAPNRLVIQELARHSIVPNVKLDREKTEENKKAAADAVEPIYIYEGDIVLDYNQVINAEVLRKLELLGLMQQDKTRPYAGLALITGMLAVSLDVYLGRSRPFLAAGGEKFALMWLLMLAFDLLLIKGFALLTVAGGFRDGLYLLPAATMPLIAAILLSEGSAYTLALYGAIAGGIMFNERIGTLIEFRALLYLLATGLAGAWAIGTAPSRSRILRAGTVAAGAGIVAVFTVALLGGDDLTLPSAARWTGEAIVQGLAAAVLTLGLIPLFEAAFGILSPMRLLELANPNQPLLRKLLLEAPGTYHHSVMVANLAEAAAEAIGADGLLARVGSYYHDVGKTKRPRYFVENQMGEESPHDRLSPWESRDIIIDHVFDGVKMLQEMRFPQAIIDIAAQHHGTTVIKYFYHKAKERKPETKPEEFRYPGPKPKTKEAAIVMIADTVEATLRAMKSPTRAEIAALVERTIREKIDDGQFDHCDLTMRELDRIREAILATLSGSFHARIEYPEESASGAGSTSGVPEGEGAEAERRSSAR